MGDPKDKKRLVVCMDGTFGWFHGQNRDSNVVKIYKYLDRANPNLLAHYQPGIGMWVPDESWQNVILPFRIYRLLLRLVDVLFAIYFDRHIMASYRFLMDHYNPGDEIYIFGASRGAYQAKFLARMVSRVGILSPGNEEMIAFVYKCYQDYERGWSRLWETISEEQQSEYLHDIKETFSREATNDIMMLGMWDCVGSVGVFELPWPFAARQYSMKVRQFAKKIRHAISIDEHRSKYLPYLWREDNYHPSWDTKKVDVQERWFPGDHTEICGGVGSNLSDIPLAWMIQEIRQDETSKPILGKANNTNAADTPAQKVKKQIEDTKNKIKQMVQANGPQDPAAEKLGQGLGLLMAMDKSLTKEAEYDKFDGPADVEQFLTEFYLNESTYEVGPFQQNTLGPPGWVWLFPFLDGWTLPFTLGISWLVPALWITKAPDPEPILWWWMEFWFPYLYRAQYKDRGFIYSILETIFMPITALPVVGTWFGWGWFEPDDWIPILWFFHRALRRYMPNNEKEEEILDDAGKEKPLANKAGTGAAILDDSALRRVAHFKAQNSPYYLWNPGARDAFTRSFPKETTDPPMAGKAPLPKSEDWTDLPWYLEIFNH